MQKYRGPSAFVGTKAQHFLIKLRHYEYRLQSKPFDDMSGCCPINCMFLASKSRSDFNFSSVSTGGASNSTKNSCSHSKFLDGLDSIWLNDMSWRLNILRQLLKLPAWSSNVNRNDKEPVGSPGSLLKSILPPRFQFSCILNDLIFLNCKAFRKAIVVGCF